MLDPVASTSPLDFGVSVNTALKPTSSTEMQPRGPAYRAPVSGALPPRRGPLPQPSRPCTWFRAGFGRELPDFQEVSGL